MIDKTIIFVIVEEIIMNDIVISFLQCIYISIFFFAARFLTKVLALIA